ncbi:response regulator [Mangrovibacillus cuniculi]|uniref:Response regulator n=1 Tax=Mangrovibacillus cuniculi TaxID=2593652 RepID=A0A7S8CAL7_9BACI|nr:response regulator [Mangrovibacillus cuniculi]QPC46469.1 response regulator [Mangrovibacillus cuniculi]
MKNLLEYQQRFLENVENQLKSMLTSDKIPGKEIRRFCHSIVGTAPTIQLNELGELAKLILDKHPNDLDHEIGRGEMEKILSPIMELHYTLSKGFPVMNKSLKDKETLTVFIIDDDITLLHVLKDYFEQNGLHVLAFTSPNQAIQMLANTKPDCLLIDIMLEDSNGIDTLEEVLQITKRSYIPVVMMTADKNPILEIESLQKGQMITGVNRYLYPLH